MKSLEQISDFITDRIAAIYERPLPFGGTPDSVELVLHCYHELWAEIHDTKEEYNSVRRKIYAEQGCGSMSFAFRHKRLNQGATTDEIAAYTVGQWQRISQELGTPISRQPASGDDQRRDKPVTLNLSSVE
ncbi:MAG TPA: hypothetical protein PLL06_05205 [Acidobacteriota bacterium]|nr:hypothetical protein [Acidobacteriota bacterium]